MRLGNVIVVLGLAAVILGVVGGESLPWFVLKFSEISLSGLEFNLGLAFLGICGISFLFTIACLLSKDRAYAISSTITSMLLIVAVADYYFNKVEILGLPAAEVALAGKGLYLVLIGGFTVLFGTLVVFASQIRWKRDLGLLRMAVIINGAIVDERVLVEQRDIIVGGKPRRSFFETGWFFILFAVLTAVIPAVVFGPMIADFVASRRNRRHLHIPPGKFPDGRKLFVVDRRGRAKVGLNEEMKGKIYSGGREMTVAEFVRSATGGASGLNYAPLENGDWGILEFDHAGVFFQVAPVDDRVAPKPLWAFDKNVAASVSMSAVVQITLILLTLFFWTEEAVRKKQPDIRKFLQVDIQTSIEEEEEPLEIGEEEDDVGKKAEGEEGKFGDPDIPPEVESKVPKRDGKMVDKIDPKKVGLTDVLSSARSNAISSILSSDTSSFQNKLAVAMSGTGSEFVMGHGSGGMGFKGTGTGGGGTGGYGRIHGLGEIDTGGGKGVTANLGKKAAKKVGSINVGSGSSQGFCQKSDITNQVRRRAGAIRACYERELQIHANLAGKITIRWTINTEGAVDGAQVIDSSLSNKAVEECVLRTIRRVRFAKPEGGVCVVQWPFVFNAG
ncbi:MAG: energy transducer TonB [Myxococcales bacterium]|nr:energy transducer TonB [Myxococcales bacterium]